MLRNVAISTSFKNPQTPIENLWAEVQPANQCLLASCCPYKRLPEPALGKGEKGPCPGPCAWEPLCDTAAFLSSSFHVTARTAKFCSSPVTYCKTEDVQVLRYVASQNLRASAVIYEEEERRKCDDLKCVRKTTKSRLSLTHHANQSSR